VVALVIGSTFWMLGNTPVQTPHLHQCYCIAMFAGSPLLVLISRVTRLQDDARLFFGVTFTSTLFLAMG
jgi:hypothetical protein